MDIKHWLVKMYLSEHFLQTAFIATVFAACIGHLVDRLMARSSFGIITNTSIVLFAIIAACSIENRSIALALPEAPMRISIFATLIGCGLLIMATSLRQWLKQLD